MSRAGVVCWEVEPLERKRRGAEEWLAIGAPWITRRLASFVSRRPPGSRLRQTLLTHVVRGNIAANNRGDYRAMFAGYARDIEMIPPGHGESADGFDAVYHGHEGIHRFILEWKAGFGRHRYVPVEIADPGGNAFAVRFKLVGTIGDSSSEVVGELGVVNRLTDGLVSQQEYFFEWADAVAAAQDASP